MHLKPDHLECAHLDIQVREPLIHVAAVLFLYILELVGAVVDLAVHQGHLELALVYLEVSVDQGEGAPGHDIVLGRRLVGHPDQLEDNHVRGL